MNNQKVYAEITNRILEQLNTGVVPWKRPWVLAGGAISHSTGQPYSTLNQMLLGRGGQYITFHAVKKLGGKVKKGARSSPVFFWNWLKYTREEKQGDEVVEKIRVIPYLKRYAVFHESDIEGIEFTPPPEVVLPAGATPDERAERIFSTYVERENIPVRDDELSSRAYYNSGSDEITLPRREQFFDTTEWYNTRFHETVHSTGHESRLNRHLGNKFGTKPYAREELVGELGAAYLIQLSGIETPESFMNSASYIDGWRKKLRNDPQAIVWAASRAQKAVDFILGKVSTEPETLEIDETGSQESEKSGLLFDVETGEILI